MPSTICPHCATYSNLTYRWGEGDHIGIGYGIDVAYTCNHCRRVLSARVMTENKRYSRESIENDIEHRRSIEWLPHSLNSPELVGVPDNISGTAEEAHRSLGVKNFRATALMARAAIEGAAKDHGVKTGNLYEKIESMRSQGQLTESISSLAHTVRKFGNGAAHSDSTEPIDVREAEGLLELMRAVLDSLYRHRAINEALNQRFS